MYTNIISGQIFNQRKVVEELDFDVGTGDMYCECSTNNYCYEPAGHVTGDIIRAASLRSLIEKGPSYREQNRINWKINEKTCKDAVAECNINGH